MDSPETFEDLVRMMDRLRDPGGCPWDREQTFLTLRSYLLEECYEVVDALDRGDLPALREELGDLLFQIIFLSRLAKEGGHFTSGDVVRGIGAKMTRRHPHVFGAAKAETAEQVLRSWEQIKRQEKGTPREGAPIPSSVLSGVPRALPALLKAQRLGTKGFDWPRPEDVLDKVEEELAELRAAAGSGKRLAAREEIGDLLFTVVMLSRRLDVDPEEALEHANLKFQRRFMEIEGELRRRAIPIEEAGAQLLDELWNWFKSQGGAEG